MRYHFRTSYSEEIQIYEDRRQLLWYALLIIAACLAPFILDEYLLGELTHILIWSLAGLGLMLLAGHCGLVSLGHGAFLACGAYMQYNLVNLSVPFLLAIPVSGVFSGLVGALFAIPALRLTGIYLAIATLALGAIAEDLIIMLEHWTGGVEGVYLDTGSVLSIEFDRYAQQIDFASPGHSFYWLCLLVVVLVATGYVNLLRSASGRALTAIRDSETSARAMGINVARYKTLAFALSCAVTGMAGALLAHFMGAFNYEAFNLLISIQLLLLITIGGLGFIQGAFIGAVLLGLMPLFIVTVRESIAGVFNLGNSTIPGIDQAVLAGLLIVFIIIEPAGVY
ncbi:MAG: branched-chain amino acid ABC transporter permease, partial [Pseudomonadota bacterium]